MPVAASPLSPPLNCSLLASLADFDDLLAFLRDELLWPLFEAPLEEMAFDYSAEELHLSPQAAARLKDARVFNLRPMLDEQPWGLFLLQFDTPAVSVLVLRETLRALVKAQHDRPAYKHEDLLFICATQNFDAWTFAHFQKREAGQPLLETFAWKRGDSHLHTLCEFNLPALKFKPAHERDADLWRRDWRQAFDVESVTQEFFKQYRQVFARIEAEIENSVPSSEDRRAWTQRLFNRLMFLFFLQKKGWLSFEGDHNYLRALFEAMQPGENFYRDRLDFSFFQGLNHLSDQPQDSQALRAIRGDVPFLNGGLFERDGHYDDKGRVEISNDAFRQIFELFEKWNFTVEESTPLDVQVSVDPEMLGKVFEELVTGRHESGSYYTPRGIVAFMCREALKGYLAPFDDSQAVARFVDHDDASGLRHPEAILESLKRVKACDPACGSGAYLLGMMQELMRLRGALFVAHQVDSVSEYEKKLQIIGHNLYGVDQDPFAANIAMLRLWLSLMIEYDGPRAKLPALLFALPGLDANYNLPRFAKAIKPSSVTICTFSA